MGQHLRFLPHIINFTCWLHVPRGKKMYCLTLEFVKGTLKYIRNRMKISYSDHKVILWIQNINELIQSEKSGYLAAQEIRI